MKNKKAFVLNLIFMFFTAAAVIVSVRLLFSGRSLWLDEAMLAWSVSKRSLGSLVSRPLDLMQSAPVLYLYAVKLITLFFGNTEVTLRAFSFASYLGVIVLSYFLAGRLKIKYPLAVCAAVSGCGILLKYSCEFKPYMTDAFAVLLVILLYSLYKSGKIGIAVLSVFYITLPWLSNPACLFIAGIYIFEFFVNIRRPVKIIVSGCAVLASFAVYYFFWLHPVIAEGGMSAYWADMRFPLKFWSGEARELLKTVIKPVGIIALIAVFSGVKAVFVTKKPEVIISVIGVSMCLAASALGLFPIAQRLWLFAYPLAVILAFEYFSFGGAAGILVSFALIFSVSGIYDYRSPESVYIEGDNLNPIVDYLKETDEFIYVYVHSVPGYCYRMKYKIPENVMLGDGYFESYNPDIEKITAHDRGYIVVSHQIGHRTDGLFSVLGKNYSVTAEFSDHGTVLYHFEKKSVKTY